MGLGSYFHEKSPLLKIMKTIKITYLYFFLFGFCQIAPSSNNQIKIQPTWLSKVILRIPPMAKRNKEIVPPAIPFETEKG